MTCQAPQGRCQPTRRTDAASAVYSVKDDACFDTMTLSGMPTSCLSPTRQTANRCHVGVNGLLILRSASVLAGAPGRIRTRDPLLRRQLLYPAELQALRMTLCRIKVTQGTQLS